MGRKRVWYAVHATVKPIAVEAIESAFDQLGAVGTAVDLLGKTAIENVEVIGYFDEDPETDDLIKYLQEWLNVYGLPKQSLRSAKQSITADSDWLAEWKRHWTPTEVGKFIIAPPWSEVGPTDKLVIRIEPNMAFGTGTHETTQLCLKAICEIYRPDMSFLDVGTGTGILAIAAAKLGCAEILTCDTDVDSVKIARENAALNDVASHIEFINGSIDDGTPSFDLVCANLTLDVITPILDLLLEKTNKFLLLSGILVEQQKTILNELQKFEISDLKFESSGEWISVLIRL